MATRVTPLAEPVVPTDAWAWTDTRLAARLHPLYGRAIHDAPRGRLVTRGLPFELARAGDGERWLVVDGRVEVDLTGRQASHVILLQFCDAWREDGGGRPTGVPVGWVMPVGEPLARVEIAPAKGPSVVTTLRRRFEVNEGIIGWGSMAFLAVPHLVEAPVPWRGPHPELPMGRFAAPGHTGPMAVLPSSWGTSQTGVQDDVPSPTDDLMLWLHAIDVRSGGAPRDLRSMRIEPVAGPGEGRLVVVAAVTTFAGRSSPLRWSSRHSIRVSGARGLPVEIDLGLVARRRPVPEALPSSTVSGWGAEATGPLTEATPSSLGEEVEVTAAADAVLTVGAWEFPLADMETDAPAEPTGAESPHRSPRVRSMSSVDRRLVVEVVDATGRRTPARVRATALDGRYLPPLGHRDEVNPGLNEDLGADTLVGGREYAYVDGTFDIDLPIDGARLEVVSGLQRPTLASDISVADLERGLLRLSLPEALSPPGEGWVAGDTHVHYLAPSTALLQAAAEGVNVVHLLATQWGDHHTNVTDIGGDIIAADGAHAVFVGSENRQNVLGHLGLVGTPRAILPFASGGPPEGRIGGAAMLLLADWLRRCREAGGLAIGAHFPLPMAEIAADIEWGLLDALEFETFDPTLQSPPVREWYRYLDAGYRLPIVGGTDKMSASVPLGQIRTWARMSEDAELTFDRWASAVRSGRTFVTSGPLLDLRVDGHEVGDTVQVTRGTSLEVELVARAAQPIISDVELVVDGHVCWAEHSSEPSTTLTLRHRLVVERTGWLAGRSRSPFAVGSAVATAMAAHTSAIYLECAGTVRRPPDLSVPLALIDGTRAWLDQIAPVRHAADAKRFSRFLDEAERRMRARARSASSTDGSQRA